MSKKYSKIKRTPSFITMYSEMSAYLKRSSPVAFLALPSAMTVILDAIDRLPRAWPVKRKRLGGVDHEFHLAIVDLAYRRIHVRYFVDKDDICYLVAVWVDGHDEPNYTTFD